MSPARSTTSRTKLTGQRSGLVKPRPAKRRPAGRSLHIVQLLRRLLVVTAISCRSIH